MYLKKPKGKQKRINRKNKNLLMRVQQGLFLFIKGFRKQSRFDRIVHDALFSKKLTLYN